MRRSVPVVLALLLVVPAAAANAGSASSTAALCGRGLKVAAQAEDGGVVCSHGPDARLDSGLGLPTDPSAPPAPCIGDGVSGARIHVLYGHPSDVSDDYANKVGQVRAAVDAADWYFEGSDSATSQHLRWLCAGGTVQVDDVTLQAIGGDGAFTFQDMYNSLVPRSKGKRSTGPSYKDPSQVYVVFVDGISNAYPYCGQGGVDADDSPGQTNRNNAGPAYSLIACWDGTSALHEIGHNLGAVQLSAPHSSGAYHCYDEADVMCYDDGGSYFLGPDGTKGTADDRTVTASCPAASTLIGGPVADRQFDCNEDDYYNPAPPAGSYLATHWDLASSAWVQP